MEKPIEKTSFAVVDLMAKQYLKELVGSISETEFLSSIPVTVNGNPSFGKLMCKTFIETVSEDLEAYWETFCSNLELEDKYKLLQTLSEEKTSSDNSWQNKIGDPYAFMENYRTSVLGNKEQQLEVEVQQLNAHLSELEKRVQVKRDVVQQSMLKLDGIKAQLGTKIENVDKVTDQVINKTTVLKTLFERSNTQ